MLTERHVHAVLRELDAVTLTGEQREAVVLRALARFDGHAPRELGKLVARLILMIDLAAARAREEHATAGRRVRCYPDVDGQAVLHARGPVARIAAIQAALTASLQALGPREAGDDRSTEEREFDLFVAVLAGTTERAGWHSHVVVPFTTALGGDTELAEVPGLGAILPGAARDLLARSLDLTQIAVDDQGRVVAVSDPIAPAAETTPGAEPTGAEPAEQTPATAATTTPVRDVLREAIGAMGHAPAAGPVTVSAYRVPPRVRRFLQARDQKIS